MQGELTSGSGTLSFRLHSHDYNNTAIIIDSVISDLGRAVGLNISGGRPAMAYSDVVLTGDRSNTFSGDTVLSNGGIQLKKSGGATAINGNIYARNNSTVGVISSHQIANTSTITLSGGSSLWFASLHSDVTWIEESFHGLIVENIGVIDFNATKIFPHYARWLYLDDLEIKNGAKLVVRKWLDDTDHLLVRRDSAHLMDTLGKIDFEGLEKKGVGLRGFDENYWEIVPWATPEPATYGAVLGAIGLALVLHRRKRKRAPNKMSALQ